MLQGITITINYKTVSVRVCLSTRRNLENSLAYFGAAVTTI